MIDPSVSPWLPPDKELKNFYKGIDDFVTKNVSINKDKYLKNKVIIDPCVGYIEFYPWEMAIIDTLIFQRLRKVTQLGLAYLVFPTLNYSRFEHTLGVVGRLNQMLQKLREKHIHSEDADIISIIDEYETTLRLSALFHDTGHCIYSHLSESIINNLTGYEETDITDENYYPSVKTIKEKFNKHYRLSGPGLSIAEIFAITIMASHVFVEILNINGFRDRVNSINKTKSSINKIDIPDYLHSAARFIAGVPEVGKPTTVFLAQLISSGLDADKLDYMSREEHFSGIKVEMDLVRILNKIKVKKVKAQNSKRLQPGLEKYSKHNDTDQQTYFILCIEKGGQFAYEEFCVARLALYEKIYLHKKVRAAEQALKNQLGKIPGEIKALNKAHYWLHIPESIIGSDTFINQSEIKIEKHIDLFNEKEVNSNFLINKKIETNLSFIEKREIPYRAFAFGPANATYESDYYSLLDGAKTKDDIEKVIGDLLSVKFWNRVTIENDKAQFVTRLKTEIIKIVNCLISNNISRKNQRSVNDLRHFLTSLKDGTFEKELIVDVPDYHRVVLSFESLYFEESSFQAIRWTIPIHRISHYYQLHRILAYIYFQKKFCDIVNLSCQKIVLDFIGTNKGDRQVYEQHTFISDEVYNYIKELKNQILDYLPDFYDGYPEIKPDGKTLSDSYSSDIINNVLQEINKYHFNKFSEPITHQEVINYLRQFPGGQDGIQEYVLELLSCIKVLHEVELEPILISVFEESISEHKKANVIPLGTSFSSATSMMKSFKGLLSKYQIGNDNIDSEQLGLYNHFIFFDDNTNSGRQALNIIAKWCKIDVSTLIEKKVYTDVATNRDVNEVNPSVSAKLKDVGTKITLCFITGTKDAEDFLIENLDKICGIKGKIEVKIRHYMKPEYSIFTPSKVSDDKNVFSKIKTTFKPIKDSIPSGALERTKEFFEFVGSQIVQHKEICSKPGNNSTDHALGYCNRESTVIFTNSVPTSTLTALWCGGSYKIIDKDNVEVTKNWQPLIPRD